MLLFYVRHGDPTYNPDSLTPLGKRQAEAVAKRLTRYGIDKIYASTSTRAIQTAEPTCEILKKDLTKLAWADEGRAWEQMSVELPDGSRTWMFGVPKYRELFCSKRYRELGDNWMNEPEFKDTTFGEGALRVQREADGFLKELGYEHDREKGCYIANNPQYDRVALFAHQGTGMLFLSAVLDIPLPLMCQRFNMSHTGVTVIDFGNDKISYPQALQVSNDSHLLLDGLPTKYNNSIYF